MFITPKDLVDRTRRNHTVGKRISKSFRLTIEVSPGFDDRAAVNALRTAFPDTTRQIVVTHGENWIQVELRPVDAPAGC